LTRGHRNPYEDKMSFSHHRLAFLAGGVALFVIACTSTVTGTGTGTGTSSGTSGTSGVSGTSSGSTGSTTGTADCPNIAGNWKVDGTKVGQCTADVCVITQSDCSITLTCGGDTTYTGTLDKLQFTYHGVNTDLEDFTCSGTIGIAGRQALGKCTSASGTCNFSADKI
jgi:hypothetical protein